MKTKRLIDIIDGSEQYLANYDVPSARLNAELIIAHILNLKRLDLYMNYPKPLEDSEIAKIKKLLVLRGKKRIPVQHIINYEGFYGNDFYINSKVLIPRPETEILVENCIEIIKRVDNPKVLDIGTGSGAIAISIGKAVKNAKILAIDISSDALSVAKKNAELNEADNVKFINSNLFENVNYSKFDLIVSNPPYISKNEYEKLMPEVREHEPKEALLADEEGVFFYNRIVEKSGKYLKSAGILAFEVGYNQAELVKNRMIEYNFSNIKIKKDYSDIPRVVIGEFKNEHQ